MNNAKVEDLSKMSAADRFQYFVKKVAACETVWGLQADDWAFSNTNEGGMILPFWPERELAECCAMGLWDSYTVTPIKLSDFMSLWLPGMHADEVKVGFFMTPDDKVGVQDPVKLMADLEDELRILNS
ncbi:MAG: DUF2750 domain-containing protein [Rubritalea sp.]|uniref:DUF2750 domain-containing protein n=1 Tax=Rubritalea sp. TaxID=2109375 RepID=UPI003242BA68